MRRSLTTLSILAIVIAMALPAWAELNWSTGITLTEKESSIQIGSRIEATHDGRLVGSWFSSSGQLPVMVQGLEFNAFGDFPGIERIQKVVLSPDHGKTEWPAELVEGKGYCIQVPNLSAGAYGLEWGVKSKDKHNRLVLIIIPINWSSSRSTSATNHAMVQMAPMGCEGYSDQQWFALLRGFVPAWASIDPGYAALVQAGQSQVAPTPTRVEASVPVTLSPNQPEPIRFMPKEEKPVRMEKVMMVLKGNNRPNEFPVTIISGLEKGDKLIFKRNNRFVAEAVITEVVPGRFIEVKITKGDGVRPQDGIFIKGGK